MRNKMELCEELCNRIRFEKNRQMVLENVQFMDVFTRERIMSDFSDNV